jgi:hypothetical protein
LEIYYSLPPIYCIVHGDNGLDFTLGGKENANIIYCMEGGSIQWSFLQNGSLVVEHVWPDGSLLIRHTNQGMRPVNSSYTMYIEAEEMVMLFPNGTPAWTLPFPRDDPLGSSSSGSLAGNGTILLVHQHLLNRQSKATRRMGHCCGPETILLISPSRPSFTMDADLGDQIVNKDTLN